MASGRLRWAKKSVGGAWLLALAFFLALRPSRAAEYRPLPPAAPAGLSADAWLLHDAARNRLILYLPGYHAPAHAYYQWVRLRRDQAFPLSFAAQAGLSLFLDNRLVFTAPAAATYTLDLSKLLPGQHTGRAAHLLGVWQPDGEPALASFRAAAPETTPNSPAAAALAQTRLPGLQGQNVFLGLLLVLGLLYGGVRTTYQPGLARILQIDELLGSSGESQTFLVRPAFSLLNLLLVVLFALSLSILLVAIHTDLQHLPLLRQFVDVPESAIAARVLLYTGLITLFVFSKYLVVSLMAYIFDLLPLVDVHYREFLRTTLLLGLLLPFVLLGYLSLNAAWPAASTAAANAAVLVLLTATGLRVARTLHRRASLFNLHLFAYLCATEILPLAVLLKLIVFTRA